MVFGKKRDYLDIPALQKKGLLKLPEQKKANYKVNKDGYVELIGSNSPNTSVVSDSTNNIPVGLPAPASSASSTFQSFWDTPVNSSTPSQQQSYFDNSSNSNNSNNSSISDNVDVSNLKVQLENLEYKFERALERIAELEGKLRS